MDLSSIRVIKWVYGFKKRKKLGSKYFSAHLRVSYGESFACSVALLMDFYINTFQWTTYELNYFLKHKHLL